MKIVKIGAIWCGGCLVMNKVWDKLKNNYSFDSIELDYDMDEDEVLKYNPGDVLPVFIVYSGEKEVLRIVGELSYDDFVSKLLEVGVLDVEKN
ncbi:MAG: thioredoxin family protein [Bacilli bacterium]|nr:thioredoxin family protein [Bacilli bacterium]